jgi:hypothetical protein
MYNDGIPAKCVLCVNDVWYSDFYCLLADLKHTNKQQNIIVYPVQVGDLYSDEIRPLIETAVNVSTELDETIPGHPIKGLVISNRFSFVCCIVA